MKIAFVCPGYNGRRHKMHVMLRKHFSIDVFALDNRRADVTAAENVTLCDSSRQMVDRAIKSGADVFHVFVNNTVTAKMLLDAGKHVVVDTHDLALLRTADPHAAAVYSSQAPKIFSSPAHLKYCSERFCLGPHVCCIYNLPPEEWVNQIRPQKKIIGDNVVYFGGFHTNPKSAFGYRCYGHLFKLFHRNGIRVHVYGTDAKRMQRLKRSGYVTVHRKLPYASLYSALTRYRVGFLGYAARGVPVRSVVYAKACVPNKAFDYMIAGIPSLAYNLGYSERFVDSWGICVDNPSQLVEAYHRARELDVQSIDRRRFVLDRYVSTIRQMYEIAANA